MYEIKHHLAFSVEFSWQNGMKLDCGSITLNWARLGLQS